MQTFKEGAGEKKPNPPKKEGAGGLDLFVTQVTCLEGRGSENSGFA